MERRTVAWLAAGLTVATVAGMVLAHISVILHANGWGIK